MKYILIALLALVFIPVYADPLENLNKIIVSNGNEYFPSSDFEVRNFKGSPITKIQGFTTSGEIYMIYTNEFSGFEKVILYDGKFHKASLKERQSNTFVPIPVIEPKIVMTSLVQNPAYLQKDMSFNIQVKDETNKAVSGADIKINLEQHDKLMKTMTGKTNAYGIFNTSIFMTGGVYDFDEWVDVEITASYGSQTVTKNFKSWVLVPNS